MGYGIDKVRKDEIEGKSEEQKGERMRRMDNVFRIRKS